MELAALHPPVVHFAVALPVLALIFDIIYLVKGYESFKKAAYYTIVAAAAFALLAFLTGGMAEEAVEDSLTGVAKDILEVHDGLGKVVMALIIAVAGLRFYAEKKDAKPLHAVTVAALAIVSIMMLYQGKLGGEMVYDHGVGVKTLSAALPLPKTEH